MSFIPVGWGEVTLRWRAATTTRDATCVVGFQNDQLDPPATAAATINALLTSATTRLANAGSFDSTYAWRGVRVVVERGNGPEIFDLAQNVAGTVVAGPIPPNGAFLVRKSTAFGGRRGRGRMFLPPIYAAETQVDSVGVIAGASVTALQTKVSNFFSDMLAANYELALLHNVSEVAPHLISALTVQTVIATQRRRLRR